MRGKKRPDIPVAESPEAEASATIDGIVIGEVDGLLWEDATGVDIVSVTIGIGQVAVPVDRGEWRTGGHVELGFDEGQVERAPLLDRLRLQSPRQTIEEVGDHYSIDLGGPPPGPDPQPLPPWWDASGLQ